MLLSCKIVSFPKGIYGNHSQSTLVRSTSAMRSMGTGWRRTALHAVFGRQVQKGRRTSVARECSALDGTKWRNILGRAVFFLPTGDEAPQDARYFRQESIEVFPLFPKGILSVRQTW